MMYPEKISHSMGFETTIMYHMNMDEPDELKDFLCAVFDKYDPKDIEKHPAWDAIAEAIDWFRKKGWKVGTYDWGDKGLQFTCTSPSGQWYRSHYNHYHH